MAWKPYGFSVPIHIYLEVTHYVRCSLENTYYLELGAYQY